MPTVADCLAEREEELALCSSAVAGARSGSGGVLVFEGSAGMGKSALLAAARASMPEDVAVLGARGAELERDFAFGAVGQLLEPTLRRASDAERTELLTGPAGVAAQLLELPGAPVGRPADADRFTVLHGLYWLVANLAVSRPVCLWVDDPQWLDASSLRFLRFLLPRLDELAVAILMTCPTDLDADSDLAALLNDPAVTTHRLRPLGMDAVAGMIARGLGRPPDADFVAACHRATGGTPFLVEALLAALRERGVLPSATEAAAVDTVEPATLRRWVRLRLSRLPEPVRRLARAVAVLESSAHGEAATLAGLAPAEATDAAEQLAAAGVVARSPLEFVQPVVRRMVYAEITAGDRGPAHASAARILADSGATSERVAEHLLRTQPSGDTWVVDQLRSAARSASRRGAPDSAMTYLRRAATEPPPSADMARVLVELGTAAASAGDPRSLQWLDEAFEAATGVEELTAAGLVRTRVLSQEQRIAEAGRMLERTAAALAVADRSQQSALEPVALWLATLDARAGVSPARAQAVRAHAAQAAADPSTLGVAALLTVAANEPADEAAELARRAVAASQGRIVPRQTEVWFRTATTALRWVEAYDEVRGLLDRAIAVAPVSLSGLLLGALLERAEVELCQGRLDAAEADARVVLNMLDGQSATIYRSHAIGVLGSVLVERGALDEADEALTAVAELTEAPTIVAARLRTSRAALRLGQHLAAEALADHLAVGDTCRQLTLHSPAVHQWRSGAAQAHLVLGDRGAASELAAGELALARRFGRPRVLGTALRTAGLVSGGADGVRLLTEAIATLEASGADLELGRALIDLGSVLRRDGQRAAAQTPLLRGLDLADRAGARPLAERALVELRASGARPRRTAVTGVAALTASERRVAELAAQGLTNRQIAQSLFVTARTVEGHLTQVFAKLQVAARGDLAPALVTTSPDP